MLGLGSGFYKLAGGDNSANIYKELKELSNYTDLDVHFDFSTLVGVHGSEVLNSVNLGAGGAALNITSNSGVPLLDKVSLSRPCVDFPNTGDDDITLNMANPFQTTGKAMTFFIVMVLDVDTTQMLVSGAPDGDQDFIQLFSAGRMRVRLNNGDATSVITSNTNDSTISYAPTVNTPMVMVWKKDSSGESEFFNDNGLFTAALTDTGDANWTIQVFGGTTAGSNVDFNGKICEVGLYDADIGRNNSQILAKELSTKWGINRRE